MPQLDFNFYCAQIFWLFVSFSLLFVAMKFWLLPPLTDILKKREEKIRHILRQADKLSAQAERTQKAYQQYVDEARQYSVRILQTAHDEVADSYKKQEKELQEALTEEIQQAEKRLEEQKNVVYSKLENITCDFMKIMFKVCYDLKFSEKKLQTEIKNQIKENQNV